MGAHTCAGVEVVLERNDRAIRADDCVADEETPDKRCIERLLLPPAWRLATVASCGRVGSIHHQVAGARLSDETVAEASGNSNSGYHSVPHSKEALN
jgi:hypothetical protein